MKLHLTGRAYVLRDLFNWHSKISILPLHIKPPDKCNYMRLYYRENTLEVLFTEAHPVFPLISTAVLPELNLGIFSEDLRGSCHWLRWIHRTHSAYIFVRQVHETFFSSAHSGFTWNSNRLHFFFKLRCPDHNVFGCSGRRSIRVSISVTDNLFIANFNSFDESRHHVGEHCNEY